MMKQLITTIASVFLLTLGVNAQHTIGGTPYGLTQNSSLHAASSVALTPLNLSQLNAEDAQHDKDGHWPRIAKAQSVNLNLSNSGTWDNLPNGDRIWRLKVESNNGQGLIFSMNNFYLPPGAKLYAYSEDGVDVLGAFTYANNPTNGYKAIGMIPQNVAYLEYYEPATVHGQGHFTIFEIAQAYRILSPQAADARDFGDSDPCQVNVNCSPEGDDWQDEKRGVARILLKDGANWGWCSGSLVNNTAQDCAPYFLTAHHCGETSSAADRAQWFFYFNYESTGCSNGTNPVPNAFSPPAGFSYTQGCTQLSHANDGGGVSGSDYKLLNLDNLTVTDMVNWNLYLNGWDAGAYSSLNTATSIHHPSGDIKKISSTTGNITTTQWNGNGLPSHWYIQWNSSTNGHGVTEGGSSGSPLFHDADGAGPQNGRIVGTLTGGSSYCATPNSPDMYGKMSYHWDQNASPFGGHLEVWLDPVGGGSTTIMDGTYPPCAPTAPNCAASASATNVVVGQGVSFTDNSTGIPTSWDWDFGDGNNSTQQNPTHSYTAPGVYTVTLTATNAQGSCTTTLIITVTASTGCDTLNFPPPGTLTVYTGGNGYVTGWNTTYADASKAELFSAYAPYTHVTGGLFYLFGVVDGGSGASVDFNVWDNSGAGGSPGAILESVNVTMSDLEAIFGQGGQGLLEITFNGPVNVGGPDFYMGITMNGFGANDSLGVVSNTNGDSNPATAWEEWGAGAGGGWYAMDDASSWGLGIGLFISPFMTDSPPTAVPSPAGQTACEGLTVNFDGSSSTNYDSLEWVLPGGTPNGGMGVNLTSQYNTAGTYPAYLIAYGACGSFHADSINNFVINPSPTVTATTIDATCQSADGTISATATGGSGSGYQYSIDGGTNFQGSGTFNGLTPGTYTVLVEDGNGCQGSTTVTINANNTPITVTATSTDENCGQSDGTITINAPGATQFSINGGISFQGSNSFTGLSAGNYDIAVEDANGCTGTTTVTVNGNSNTPSITSVTGTDENCGGSDGTITINATGGTGTLEYSADGTNYSTSNTITGLSAGVYTVYVRDANGCESTDTYTIINVGGPTITGVTVNDVTCNGANDGSIDISATTGAGTLSYSIDGTNYVGTSLFSGLAAGTYTVYVDNGACITTDGPHVINEPTAVVHTATVTNAGCSANGQIDVTATGGSGTFQYSIDGGSNYQSGGSFTGLAAGTYQVIAIDANGCTSIVSTETVGSLPPIVASATGANETCSAGNGSISISATGGDGTYQFSINGGSSYQGTGTFTGLSAGTYNISVIDASGCVDTDIITITNTGGVTVTTSGNQTICDGNTATLNASGATNYNWFDGATAVGTGSSLSVSPSTTTTYTVIGDDGTCFDTTTVTVTVNSVPTTTVTSDTTICDGESIVLTGAGGTSYFWAHSGETTASVTVTPTNTTTYSVVAFNGTCQGNIASVVVTIAPAAVANAGSDVTTTYLGSGGTVNFNNTGSTGVSYDWDFGDGNSSTSASPTHNYTAPGTYTVILTATLGNCTDTDTLIITVLSGIGIEEASAFENAITVYPNPSNGLINVGFDLASTNDVSIKVTDAVGKLIAVLPTQGVRNNTVIVDITDQAKGVYFVNISNGLETVTKRITLME